VKTGKTEDYVYNESELDKWFNKKVSENITLYSKSMEKNIQRRK